MTWHFGGSCVEAVTEVREIDGASFDDFAGICAQFSRSVLLGEHEWHGNLDALNDLAGGFAAPEMARSWSDLGGGRFRVA